MARAFAEIAFTPSVRAEQAAMGSAKAYGHMLEPGPTEGDELGEPEADFIAARDGFYQASVSETGWPYVQFRGGPAGFLKVLDAKTVAYADFRGNRQYVSKGNLRTNCRISLIFMDYPNQRRLKILGRAAFVDAAGDPALVGRVAMPNYKARIERVAIIKLAAFDWNCPQHIPRRLTLAELEHHLAPLRARLDHLTAENEALKAFLGRKS